MYMLLTTAALAAFAAGRLAEHALFDHAHRLHAIPTSASTRT